MGWIVEVWAVVDPVGASVEADTVAVVDRVVVAGLPVAAVVQPAEAHYQVAVGAVLESSAAGDCVASYLQHAISIIINLHKIVGINSIVCTVTKLLVLVWYYNWIVVQRYRSIHDTQSTVMLQKYWDFTQNKLMV